MARRLTRDARGGVIGGVAAGFGEYLEVDPVLVRLAFVLLSFVHGIGVLFYLACWFVVPRRDAVLPGAPMAGTGFAEVREVGAQLAGEARAASPDATSAQLAVGSVLVLLGALFLAHNLDWLDWPRWMRFDVLWPLLLVALGLGLVAKSRRVPSV